MSMHRALWGTGASCVFMFYLCFLVSVSDRSYLCSVGGDACHCRVEDVTGRVGNKDRVQPGQRQLQSRMLKLRMCESVDKAEWARGRWYAELDEHTMQHMHPASTRAW